jgi:hypothetical protein
VQLARNGIEQIEQAIEHRQCILREEQLLLAYHPALTAEPQHSDLIVEIASSAVPAVMYFTETRKRGVQADDAGVLPLLQPGAELVAAAYAQPAEIDDLEFCAAPFA